MTPPMDEPQTRMTDESSKPLGAPDPETMARLHKEAVQRSCDYAISMFEADIRRLLDVIATLKKYRPR